MTRLTCTHCQGSFTPSIDVDGEPVYRDDHGAISCDGCTCSFCGSGHPDADERADCASAFTLGDFQAVDPDLLRDIAQDAQLVA